MCVINSCEEVESYMRGSLCNTQGLEGSKTHGNKQSQVVFAYDPNPLEGYGKAGGSQVQVLPGLQSEFKACLPT